MTSGSRAVLSRRGALALPVAAGLVVAGGSKSAHASRGDALPPAVAARLEGAMREAIEQARMARFPFGAVLLDVASGDTVFRAHNTAGDGDPTAHAEVNALRGAGLAGIDLTRTFLVTSAESCPMCASAAMWGRIAGVAFGTSIADLIRFGWGQIDVAQATIVQRTTFWTMPLVGGVLRAETDPLYRSPPS